jgi:hypothetical protein
MTARSALQSGPSSGNEEGNTKQGRHTERATQNQVLAVIERNAVNLLPPAGETSVSQYGNRMYAPRPAYEWTAQSIAWTLWQGWWLAIWLASLWVWLAVLEGLVW